MRSFILACALCLFSISCWAQVFQFVAAGALTNPPSDSRSVNFVDVNGDGLDDLFISNGPEGGAPDFLYLNEGGTTFSLQEDQPFYQVPIPSDGAAFADVDNDGDLDAFVASWHGALNGFYLNDGTGQFSSASNTPLNQTGTYSEAADWGDFNGDGWLDLFVTNSAGATRSNFMYQQVSPGTFEQQPIADWSAANSYSRSVSWVDYDGDHDPDLYVTNENGQPNELYINQGGQTYLRAENLPILEQTGSTITHSWGDIDNDGDLDLFLGNAGYFQPQPNQLFRNMGGGDFEAITGSPLASTTGCTYGSSFGDVDNDADLDLVVSNGYCTADGLADLLFLNDGTGHFTLAEADVWPSLPQVCSFGIAMGDLNNDGFLDIAIAHCKNNAASPPPPNSILLNTPNSYNWLKVQLSGTLSNRSAIGATVEITAQVNGMPLTQQRIIQAQTGYAGQNSLTAHFGLQSAQTVEALTITWPSGQTQSYTDVAVNQTMVIEEEEVVSAFLTIPSSPITIAPNPVSGQSQGLRLLPADNQPLPDFEVRLYDSTGRLLLLEEIGNGFEKEARLSWPVDGARSGIYFLQLWDEQELFRVFPILKVD